MLPLPFHHITPSNFIKNLCHRITQSRGEVEKKSENKEESSCVKVSINIKRSCLLRPQRIIREHQRIL